jgi:hypothetical protein
MESMVASTVRTHELGKNELPYCILEPNLYPVYLLGGNRSQSHIEG